MYYLLHNVKEKDEKAFSAWKNITRTEYFEMLYGYYIFKDTKELSFTKMQSYIKLNLFLYHGSI